MIAENLAWSPALRGEITPWIGNDYVPMAVTGTFCTDLASVLRGPGYRKLLATRLVSQLGDGVLNVGLVSYVFFSPERAVTASAAASGFAVLLLPYSLIGPFAGTLLDRWFRRQLLLVTSLLRAGGALVLAWMTAAAVPAAFLAVMALAVIGLNRFFLSGQGASLPRVVQPDDLVMGNSVTPTLGSVAAALGGLVGLAASRATSSDAGVLVVAAGCFLGSALLTVRLGPTSLGPDSIVRRSVGRDELTEVVVDLGQALRHLRSRRPAGWGLVVMSLHRFCWAFVIVMAILIYRNLFYPPSDPEAALGGLAITFGASALGIALAAVITPIATRRISEEAWISLLLVLTSVLLLAPVVDLSEPVMVATAGVLGLAVQGVKICVDTLVQRSVDDHYRGRAFAIYDMAFNVSMVVAAIVAAVVLPADGWSPLALIVLAVFYAVLAGAYRWVTRRPDYPVSVVAA